MEKLELVVTKTEFSDMGVVDLQGNARNVNGKAANIYDVQFVQEVLAGNRYISDTAYNKEGQPYLLLAIPMHQRGEIAGILYGRYLIEDILYDVEWETEGDCYFQIVDSQGNYITRSNSQNVWVDSIPDLWIEL